MKKISLLCAALLLLAGCSAPPRVEPSDPGAATATPSVRPVPTEQVPAVESVAPSPTPVLPEPPVSTPVETPLTTAEPMIWDGRLETLTTADFPAAMATGDEVLLGRQPLYLVSQVDGQNLRLYALAGGQGLILRMEDAWQYFDLPYRVSPLHDLPQIAWGDYDGDMEFEVALHLYIGDGLWDLHVIELDADGLWTAHWLNPEDYQAILTAGITTEYDAALNTLTITAGESSLSVDLTAAGIPVYDGEAGVSIAPIAEFSCSGDDISARFLLNAHGTSGVPVAELTASVVYTGSAFGLANFALFTP